RRELHHGVLAGAALSLAGRRPRQGRVPVGRLAVALLLVACGKLMQSDECARYVACAEAVDATSYRVVNGEYGPNGTCWVSGQGTADTCTMVCDRERQVLLASDAGMDKTECQ